MSVSEFTNLREGEIGMAEGYPLLNFKFSPKVSNWNSFLPQGRHREISPMEREKFVNERKQIYKFERGWIFCYNFFMKYNTKIIIYVKNMSS